MITGVKQDEGHTVDACVNCLLQRRKRSAGVERQVNMMRGLFFFKFLINLDLK